MLKALRMLFLAHSSERVAKTGTEGTLRAEAIYINLSLHYLEQVCTSSWQLNATWAVSPLPLVSTMQAYCENRQLLPLQLWWFVHQASNLQIEIVIPVFVPRRL